MRLLLKTKVNQKLSIIHSKFNEELFIKLAPPLMNLKVERFDGCLKGHEVHLKMDLFGLMSSRWISLITSSVFNENEFTFIDEGTIIPPPLKKWTHTHRVEKINENSCWVIDDIEYSTNNKILDNAIYPALYSMFKLRSPIYKREL